MVNGITVIDDFAHHPTAIAATLSALEPLAHAAGGRLWAVFEPRSNTVRRRIFQDQLPESFAPADEVLLAPVYQKKDTLAVKDLLDTEAVASTIAKGKGRGRALKLDEIAKVLVRETQPKDTVVLITLRKVKPWVYPILWTKTGIGP